MPVVTDRLTQLCRSEWLAGLLLEGILSDYMCHPAQHSDISFKNRIGPEYRSQYGERDASLMLHSCSFVLERVLQT